MELITEIDIDGQQYLLRYPGLAQIIIQKKAGDFLGIPGKRMNLSDLMTLAVRGDVEAQVYLLWQGIMGGMPEQRKMKFEDAVELREKFLLSQAPDDGSRYMQFLEILGEAVDAAFGADRKKSQAKITAEKKSARLEELEMAYLAKMRAEDIHGTGEKPPESA